MAGSYENRIREECTKKRLTRAQVVEASGIPLTRLQRIEVGLEPPRIEVANRISEILRTPIESLFPATELSFKRLLQEGKGFSELISEPVYIKLMESAGIDMDAPVWIVKLWLRRGKHLEFFLSSLEKHRLWQVLGSSNSIDGFVIFDSDGERIALNRRHLVGWQFLFEIARELNRPDPADGYLSVLFADRTRPLLFGIDYDTEELGEEGNDGFPTQLQDVFCMLGMAGESEDVIINFNDEDGERLFLRAAEVVLVRMPVAAVEPKLYKLQVEDDELSEFGAKNTPTQPTSIQ